PEWSLVSLIEASPSNAGTAYVAVDAHKLDDLKPYIYKTSDFGKSWTKITNGIPATAYVHAVREDPGRKGLLFAGTETGLYVSFNDGAEWQPLQLNLPQTPIHDLVIHGDDLVVATHGRSFWILDDLTPLRQVQANLAAKDLHLFKPQKTILFRTGGVVPPRYFRWYGENSPSGAIIDYYFKSKPKDEVKLVVLDSHGQVVRKLSSVEPSGITHQQEWPDQPPQSDLLPSEAGLNRFIWDFRYDSPAPIPDAVWDGGDGPKGPMVVPGKYQIKLSAGSATETVPLEIVMDPRVKTTQADLEKQIALELKISESISRLDGTVNQIRNLRSQLDAVKRRAGSDEKAKSVMDAAAALGKKMTAIEEELINPNVKATEDTLNYPVRLNDKLAYLLVSLGSADMAPTEQYYAVYEDLNQKLSAQLANWSEIVSKDLPALNDSIRQENITVIAPDVSKQN
ncbi:MAG: glycosyl hydrolase, partial [Candidatus Acidiferrales bacterium]